MTPCTLRIYSSFYTLLFSVHALCLPPGVVQKLRLLGISRSLFQVPPLGSSVNRARLFFFRDIFTGLRAPFRFLNFFPFFCIPPPPERSFSGFFHMFFFFPPNRDIYRPFYLTTAFRHKKFPPPHKRPSNAYHRPVHVPLPRSLPRQPPVGLLPIRPCFQAFFLCPDLVCKAQIPH